MISSRHELHGGFDHASMHAHWQSAQTFPVAEWRPPKPHLAAPALVFKSQSLRPVCSMQSHACALCCRTKGTCGVDVPLCLNVQIWLVQLLAVVISRRGPAESCFFSLCVNMDRLPCGLTSSRAHHPTPNCGHIASGKNNAAFGGMVTAGGHFLLCRPMSTVYFSSHPSVTAPKCDIIIWYALEALLSSPATSRPSFF